VSPLLRLLPLSLLPALLAPGRAPAEPVDLTDARPRAVSVRFEASPDDAPGALAARWGPWLGAWLEPETGGRARVTVPGALLERHVFADYAPRPGSFSDYVFRFDVATGHVLAAGFSGALVRRLRLGLLRLDSEVELRASMTTLAPAGFAPGRRILGELVFRYCEPAEREGECTAVAPRPYDPATGYVNAVGVLLGRTGLVTSRSFSPLGEAELREGEPPAEEPLEEPTLAAAP
jgi:hypothetical protein